MKRPFLILSLIMMTAVAQAQPRNTMETETRRPAPEYKIGLGLQGLPLLLGALGMDVDVRLNQKISLMAGGMLMSNKDMTSTDSKTYSYKASYSEIYVGPKWMITGEFSSSGAYAVAGLGYITSSVSDYSPMNLGGSLSTPEVRAVIGYQWVLPSSFRFNVGLGGRSLKSADIIVKDSSGKEVYREQSGALSGLVLDGAIAYMF